MPSYTEAVKRAFLSELPKRPCCRRAMTFGALLFLQTDENGVWLPSDLALPFLLRSVREQFGREGEAVRERRGRRMLLVFDTGNLLSKSASFVAEPTIKNLIAHPCEECVAAFLRGMFITTGHVLDPGKGYAIEWTPQKHLPVAEHVLSSAGLSPRRGVRQGKTYLYIKQSGQIEDFFAMVGQSEVTFSLMNEKIARDFRNNANRIASCESNNIARVVSAAGAQIDWIERLAEADKLSLLSDELRQAAEARLANREAPLAHLAANMVPPLTKSGMNHRLQKVVAFAKKVFETEEKQKKSKADVFADKDEK